jgi:hypothetical protein
MIATRTLEERLEEGPGHQLGRIERVVSGQQAMPNTVIPIGWQPLNGTGKSIIIAVTPKEDYSGIKDEVYLLQVDMPVFLPMDSRSAPWVNAFINASDSPLEVEREGYGFSDIIYGALARIFNDIPKDLTAEDIDLRFGRPSNAEGDLMGDKELEDTYQNEVRRAMSILHRAEQFTRMFVLNREFYVQNGHIYVPEGTRYSRLVKDMAANPVITTPIRLDDATKYDFETVDGDVINVSYNTDNGLKALYAGLGDGPDHFPSQKGLLRAFLSNSKLTIACFGPDAGKLRIAGEVQGIEFSPSPKNYVPGKLIENISAIVSSLSAPLFSRSQHSIFHLFRNERAPFRDNLLYSVIRTLYKEGDERALELANQRSTQDVGELEEIYDAMDGLIWTMAKALNTDVSALSNERLESGIDSFWKYFRHILSEEQDTSINYRFEPLLEFISPKAMPQTDAHKRELNVLYRDASQHYEFLRSIGLPGIEHFAEYLEHENKDIRFMAHKFIRELGVPFDAARHYAAAEGKMVTMAKFTFDEKGDREIDETSIRKEEFRKIFQSNYGINLPRALKILENMGAVPFVRSEEALFENSDFALIDAASAVPAGYRIYDSGQGLILPKGKSKPRFFIRNDDGIIYSTGTSMLKGRNLSESAKELATIVIDCVMDSQTADEYAGDRLIDTIHGALHRMKYAEIDLDKYTYKKKDNGDVIAVIFKDEKGKEGSYEVPVDIVTRSLQRDYVRHMDSPFTDDKLDTQILIDGFNGYLAAAHSKKLKERSNAEGDVENKKNLPAIAPTVSEYVGIDRFKPVQQVAGSMGYSLFDLMEYYSKDTLLENRLLTHLDRNGNTTDSSKPIFQYHRMWGAL